MSELGGEALEGYERSHSLVRGALQVLADQGAIDVSLVRLDDRIGLRGWRPLDGLVILRDRLHAMSVHASSCGPGDLAPGFPDGGRSLPGLLLGPAQLLVGLPERLRGGAHGFPHLLGGQPGGLGG
jgi:hypothetical protein